MNKMEVKLKEVRTVLEGKLSDGGVFNLDYSTVGENKPTYIGINATLNNGNINGGYYPEGNSLNINITNYNEGTRELIDEIYHNCKSVLEIKEVSAVKKG